MSSGVPLALPCLAVFRWFSQVYIEVPQWLSHVWQYPAGSSMSRCAPMASMSSGIFRWLACALLLGCFLFLSISPSLSIFSCLSIAGVRYSVTLWPQHCSSTRSGLDASAWPAMALNDEFGQFKSWVRESMPVWAIFDIAKQAGSAHINIDSEEQAHDILDTLVDGIFDVTLASDAQEQRWLKEYLVTVVRGVRLVERTECQAYGVPYDAVHRRIINAGLGWQKWCETEPHFKGDYEGIPVDGGIGDLKATMSVEDEEVEGGIGLRADVTNPRKALVEVPLRVGLATPMEITIFTDKRENKIAFADSLLSPGGLMGCPPEFTEPIRNSIVDCALGQEIFIEYLYDGAKYDGFRVISGSRQ